MKAAPYILDEEARDLYRRTVLAAAMFERISANARIPTWEQLDEAARQNYRDEAERRHRSRRP